MRKLLARASVTGFMPCRSADCGKPNKPPYKTINRVIVLCLAWDSQTIKGNFPASLRPFYKDRLLRFGAELVFAICAAKNVEVVILNQGEDTTFEDPAWPSFINSPCSCLRLRRSLRPRADSRFSHDASNSA